MLAVYRTLGPPPTIGGSGSGPCKPTPVVTAPRTRLSSRGATTHQAIARHLNAHHLVMAARGGVAIWS